MLTQDDHDSYNNQDLKKDQESDNDDDMIKTNTFKMIKILTSQMEAGQITLRLTVITKVHTIQTSPVSTSEGYLTPFLDSNTNGLNNHY